MSKKTYMMVALAVLAVLTIAVPASAYINLSYDGAEVTCGETIFMQNSPNTAAGTGTFDPFLQIGPAANMLVVQGYSTDYLYDKKDYQSGFQFETTEPTHALLLSRVPQIEIGGVVYREFFGDFNEVSAESDRFISVDDLQIYLTSNPEPYDYTYGTEFGTFSGNPDAMLNVWSLDNCSGSYEDTYILVNGDLTPGSGKKDIAVYIPDSMFEDEDTCDYGEAGCEKYVIFYSKYGVTEPNSDGFEEWAVQIRPILDVTKTATGTYDREYTWTIEKGDDATYGIFAGDNVTHTYDVVVNQTVTESNFGASGEIIIFNSGEVVAPITSVEDLISGGTTATVICDQTFSAETPYELAIGDYLNCTYTATLSDKTPRANTVTVTVVEADLALLGSGAVFMDTEQIVFGDPTTVIGEPTINVDDDILGPLGSASGDYTFNPEQVFECSSDPGDYADGFYSDTVINTAMINETGQYDNATITVNCYAPVVSKTAAGTYDEMHTWTIEKSVDQESQSAFAGDTVDYEWTVVVTEDVTEENFAVSGTITVVNPNVEGAMVVNLTDVMDDGTDASITGCTGGTLVDSQLTIPAGGTATCDFSAVPQDRNATLNTATAMLNDIAFTGTDAVEWTVTVIDGTVTLDDDSNTAFPLAISEGGTWNFTEEYTCSGDVADYTDGAAATFSDLNLAQITSGDVVLDEDNATATVNCYAPVVSKDAAASYTRTYTWNITKDFDATYEKFIGDPATTHGYEVSVNQTAEESAFAVSGTITVTNPNPDAAMTVSLADVVGDKAATLDCGGTLEVPAGGSATCNYSAPLDAKTDGTNTVTATLNEIGFVATADYVFGDPTTVVGSPTINVNDTNGEEWTASGDATWNYTEDFVCSTDPDDYEDGVYSSTSKNTATITETGQFDNATVTVNCYAPVVSKDAAASYTRTYTWNITKDFDATYEKFIGDPATAHEYEVSVNQTAEESAFAVNGTITVTNPNPDAAMTVSLADMVGGKAATLDCGGNLTVPAGESATCTYSAPLDAKTDGTNTVTATLNGIGFVATANYAFGDPTTEVGYSDIAVTDTNGGDWTASGDATWTYTKDFVCSADPDDYTDGVYNFTHDNIATITETGQSDNATVTVNCYAPVVSKNADARYDERHTWDIEKSVDNESQSGYPGDTLDWTWTVDVNETAADENFTVTGTITVKNPSGSPGDMIVSVADVLDDGTIATVDCGDGATSLTLVPGATGTCNYSANPADGTATENTATATFNGTSIQALAAVGFSLTNTINGFADVDDDQEPYFPLNLTAGEGPWVWTETQDHTCSGDRCDYDGMNGTYSATLINNATVTGSDGQSANATASTTYTCEASFVDIYKTTNGQPADSTKDIVFKLYSDLTELETQSTLGNGAEIQFDTALVPGANYTICENPVPAGYTFEIIVDGGNVLTYAGPPGESNPTGEIQCFDFTAGTVGTTLLYEIENRYPGGAPRTPGYWKNWATCSGGNQAETAAALGGVAEGVYLIDDLLPQTIGSLTIDNCGDGVLILNAYSLDKEKNMNNDAAYTLAKALLAARLNQDAGACVPTDEFEFDGETLTFEQVLAAADDLLTDVGFDGTGGYLGPKDKQKADLRSDALYLYGIIDNYNNAVLCTGEYSH